LFKFFPENINLVVLALEKSLWSKDKIIYKIEKRIFRKSVTVFVLSIIFVGFFLAISINTVFASIGRIATTHCYPVDGETYQVIDHFTVQFSAVNTNTTVSVSIDGGAPIQMIYSGLISGVAAGDGLAHDWFTWETIVPAIITPGLHSFQFLSNYYVWQEIDQSWAEFNYSSNILSFMIENLGQPNFSDNNGFKNKESSLSTPESTTQKMAQPITNSADSERVNLDPDSTLAFLVGTSGFVACAFSILVGIVIQILSRRNLVFN
jgi:hypothetical protein